MARPSRRRERDPFEQSEQSGQVTVISQLSSELFYDYDLLPSEHRDAVRRAARTIKPLLKRTAEDIFIIGAELRAVKAMLPHGKYTEWLSVEFGLSDRMAQHFVNVRERLGPKSDKFSVLPPSTLYLLAAPSTPDEAIQEIEQRLDSGDRLTVAGVQRTIKVAKRQQHPSSMTIEGEVVGGNKRTPPAAPSRSDVEALITRIDEALEALDPETVQLWSGIFNNNDLGRARNDLFRLRAEAERRIEAGSKRDLPT